MSSKEFFEGLDERERAARICEAVARLYSQRGRECCARALDLAASRIRVPDAIADKIGDVAKMEMINNELHYRKD